MSLTWLSPKIWKLSCVISRTTPRLLCEKAHTLRVMAVTKMAIVLLGSQCSLWVKSRHLQRKTPPKRASVRPVSSCISVWGAKACDIDNDQLRYQLTLLLISARTDPHSSYREASCHRRIRAISASCLKRVVRKNRAQAK